ncbi:hypothetical protein Bca101_011223 [Brassica carinata]
MDSSGTINGRDGYLDEQDPFGNNKFLNYAWLNNIQIPDNLYPQDANPHPLSPPRLTHFTFRWQEILDGTQNLLNSEVYLCDFPRFDKVGAAKIRDLQDGEAHPEFVAEIKALHRPNHPNLVKLLGKCVNREHCVVVHEFMPKGSLDCYLFAGSKTNPVLDWYTRMRIAVGVAEALVYLSGFGLATRIVENEHGVEQQHRDPRVKEVQDLVPVLSREECMPVVADVALAKRYSVEGLVRLFHVARMCMDEEVVKESTSSHRQAPMAAVYVAESRCLLSSSRTTGVVSSYFSDEERSPEELIVRNQSSSLRQATLLSGFASSETEASQDTDEFEELSRAKGIDDLVENGEKICSWIREKLGLKRNQFMEYEIKGEEEEEEEKGRYD